MSASSPHTRRTSRRRWRARAEQRLWRDTAPGAPRSGKDGGRRSAPAGHAAGCSPWLTICVRARTSVSRALQIARHDRARSLLARNLAQSLRVAPIRLDSACPRQAFAPASRGQPGPRGRAASPDPRPQTPRPRSRRSPDLAAARIDTLPASASDASALRECAPSGRVHRSGIPSLRDRSQHAARLASCCAFGANEFSIAGRSSPPRARGGQPLHPIGHGRRRGRAPRRALRLFLIGFAGMAAIARRRSPVETRGLLLARGVSRPRGSL